MSKPLKIIIFEGSLNATSFINRLIEGLAQKHEVYVLGFDSKIKRRIPRVNYVSVGSSQNTFQLLIRSISISLKSLFLKGNISVLFKTFGGVSSLNKERLKEQNLNAVIKNIQPDILHFQWVSLLSWLTKLEMPKKTKVVLSQRGYQNNVRPFVDEENFKFLQAIYPTINGFHSVSKAISIEGDKIYNSKTKIDRVVYTGFNLDELSFSEERPQNEVLKIISIGRPHWKKGYKDALLACKILVEKGVEFKYEIIGAANNEELQYLIHEYQLGSMVSLKTKVSQEEVYRMMKASDLFLLPSLEEGLPNVMVEAMALGVPVIATDCGGVAELLDETTGLLVPIRNPEAMANAILRYKDHSAQETSHKCKNARLKVEERHTEIHMIENMEALYLKCLES